MIGHVHDERVQKRNTGKDAGCTDSIKNKVDGKSQANSAQDAANQGFAFFHIHYCKVITSEFHAVLGFPAISFSHKDQMLGFFFRALLLSIKKQAAACFLSVQELSVLFVYSLVFF